MAPTVKDLETLAPKRVSQKQSKKSRSKTIPLSVLITKERVIWSALQDAKRGRSSLVDCVMMLFIQKQNQTPRRTINLTDTRLPGSNVSGAKQFNLKQNHACIVKKILLNIFALSVVYMMIMATKRAFSTAMVAVYVEPVVLINSSIVTLVSVASLL